MEYIIIYGLYDTNEHEIRYVGKTNKKDLNKRLREHIKESQRKNNNTHKINWINSVIKDNKNINIKCLEVANNDNWAEKEKYWISKFENLTNSTEGGKGGHGIIYNISYEECKKYVKNNLNISSKSEWYKNELPSNIPRDPRKVYLNRGWISWGDFLNTGRIQDNIKSNKYMSYVECKEYVNNNLDIKTIKEWSKNVKENKIPDNIPNRPDRYFKNRGWISWGDFLSTYRVANQYKKDIFLSYKDSSEFIKNNNITTMKEFRKFNLPNNIPTNPQKYYKEWTNWGDFFGTGKKQDNELSANYLSYSGAKKYIEDNLSIIKSEKIWKEFVKNNKIPKIIPNHPELFYNRKIEDGLVGKTF
jgi:hypothetical protein